MMVEYSQVNPQNLFAELHVLFQKYSTGFISESFINDLSQGQGQMETFFSKGAGLPSSTFIKRTPLHVFSYNFCKILQNTYSVEHLQVTYLVAFEFHGILSCPSSSLNFSFPSLCQVPGSQLIQLANFFSSPIKFGKPQFFFIPSFTSSLNDWNSNSR